MHVNRLTVDSSSASTALCELGKKYPTDKAARHELLGLHRHAYFPIYDLIFSGRRRLPVVFGEVGILDNMSMRCWREYFDKASLYGFDISNDLIAKAKNDKLTDTQYYNMDVSVPESINSALENVHKTFDILVEDTTHQLPHQLNFIIAATPHLSMNGILVIEDLFKTTPEQNYIDGISSVEKFYDVMTFITSQNEMLYSEGWNNDKMLVLQRNHVPFEKPDSMFLNIITPCSRPQNLAIISESINIPRDRYRWIVVFDLDEIPKDIPPNCEAYAIKDAKSCCGNAQRNLALGLVKDGYIYFNDDDTIIHPKMWDKVKNISADIISFSQEFCDGAFARTGQNLYPNGIDTHQFIVSAELVGDTRWNLPSYDADGKFIQACAAKKTCRHVVLPEILSVYNYLRCK